MKVPRIAIVTLVILLVTQGLVLNVSADMPAGAWVTGFQVQNGSTTQDAHITVTFYWAAGQPLAGTVAHSFTDTVPAGKSLTYYVPTNAKCSGVPANFVGSVVVSSDVAVAAIINTAKTAAGTPADPYRYGSAAGVGDPGTTVYVPYLRKNFYGRNSYIAVQNTAASTATVTVRYFTTTGSELTSAVETIDLPGYTTKIFYQNENANIPNNFNGSAIINGTQPLATIINDANLGTSVGTSHFESYNGFNSGVNKLYFPKLDVNYSGYQSGFQIQNVGTEAAVITMTYKIRGNVFTKVSPSINPGAAWNVYLANSPASGIPNGFSGSGGAIAESTQPMVGIVNIVNDTLGHSIISSAIADGSATNTILFPKYDSKYYTEYNSGITIQNMGTTTTTLRAVFSKLGSDITANSPEIGPGASYTWYGPNVVPALGTQFTGSVVVVSLNDQPIAGTATQFNLLQSGDTFMAYNGINK